MLTRERLIRGGLDALYRSGAHRALEPVSGGLGVIFTLHRVRPANPSAGQGTFAPNSILEITPEFLEAAIGRIRGRGIDIVSLDEARARILAGDERRFAAFTIDDGYRDTAEIAWPVFARLDCPFAVYVATGLIDRTVNLWWIALERAIAAANAVEFTAGGRSVRHDCRTPDEKSAAFAAVYWPLRAMGEEEKLEAVAGLCARHDVDIAAIAESEGMTWDDLRAMADDPAVTIGAHTVDHPALARLDADWMNRELIDARARLAEMLGEVPRHLAYPYGDAGSAGPREFAAASALGFETAVTTRKGVIHRDHGGHLCALPRVSLNGNYQDPRFLDVFISGAPFALARGFRRVDAA